MYKFLVKSAGSGYTANCISLNADLNSYAVVDEEKTYKPGTVFNFDYTGKVLELELLPGKYKLECWGAQGGNVYYQINNNEPYSAAGSKGGYSEGVLTIVNPTTAYIFVGGKGANYTSSGSDGGWNGGGGSAGETWYSTHRVHGITYPACGGGATDIATVTSDMSYSNYTTNRSDASLLSRCIVAGGGAGASSGFINTSGVIASLESLLYNASDKYSYSVKVYFDGVTSHNYIVDVSSFESVSIIGYEWTNSSNSLIDPPSTVPFLLDTPYNGRFGVSVHFSVKDSGKTVTVLVKQQYSDKSKKSSNSAQYGGGESGGGNSPGKQTSGGGTFGFGKNQTMKNYACASGAGGAGWYGGNASASNSSIAYLNFSGGGSGFVNTAENASSRPSGYTGLQLDSGTTKAGNVSFKSPTGDDETGHTGNGYARITVLNPNE